VTASRLWTTANAFDTPDPVAWAAVEKVSKRQDGKVVIKKMTQCVVSHRGRPGVHGSSTVRGDGRAEEGVPKRASVDVSAEVQALALGSGSDGSNPHGCAPRIHRRRNGIAISRTATIYKNPYNRMGAVDELDYT